MSPLLQLVCLIFVIALISIIFVLGNSRYIQYVQRQGETYISDLMREVYHNQSRHLSEKQMCCFLQQYLALPQQYVGSFANDNGLYADVVNAILLVASQLGRSASLQFGWRAPAKNDMNQNLGRPVLWLLFSDKHKRRFAFLIERRGTQVLPLETFTEFHYGFIIMTSRMSGTEVAAALAQIQNLR